MTRKYHWPLDKQGNITGAARFVTAQERNDIEAAFDTIADDLSSSGMAFVGGRRVSWAKNKAGDFALNIHREKA